MLPQDCKSSGARTDANRQLKFWLDPSNTGVLKLNGKNQCNNVNSLNEFKFKENSIYPNPVIDHLKLNFNETITKAEIYNTRGELVLVSDYHSIIPVIKLEPGMYFLKVFTEEGIYHKQFIKE